jgi:hypothetical protein
LKLYGAIALCLLLSGPLGADADSSAGIPVGNNGADIVSRYVEAIQAEQAHPQPVSMEVDMDATLPRLKKEGRFHAFRFITRVGKIFYDGQRFEGDNTIKKEVIARYIQAEKEARTKNDGSLAVDPENYRFKYKGVADYAGKPAHVFQVTPKKKRVGLYKGELWIDVATYLPLREWGELVKNPSVFLKNVYFVRDYTIQDGMAVPRRLISDISTRIVGQAKLTVWYGNVKVGDAAPLPTAILANGTAEMVRNGGGNP